MDELEEIKSSIDLKAHMQRRGVNFNGNKAYCPFHEDKNPSLSINKENGIWVWHCFSDKHDLELNGGTIIDFEMNYGINEAEAIKKLKKEYNNLDDPTPKKKKYGTIETEYIYMNEKGKEVYRKVRFKNPKEFITKPSGKKQIPYRLPELLKNDEIWLVEGEKDTDALMKLDIPATTVGGVKNWKNRYVRYFKDKKVVICLDAGTQEYMKKIAEELRCVTKGVRIIDLEEYGLNKDEDISDYIENSVAEDQEQLKKAVLQLAKEAPVYEKSTHIEPKLEESVYVDNDIEIHPTDTGNAQRFAQQHHKSTRYIHEWKKWLHFNGIRWEKDSTGRTQYKAKLTVRKMYEEASKIKDTAERKEKVKFALSSESSHKIKAFLSLAESEPGIPLLSKNLDSNPWLLNVKNGTLDLKTGEIKPHNSDDFITKLAPITYDPEAKCPRWENFLNEIMAGNKHLISFLQKSIGYALTGDTGHQCFFIFYGIGANGKTTFLQTISTMLGDYAQQTPVKTILRTRYSGIPNDVARLKGTRFVSAMEVEQGRKMAEPLVKSLTGGDTITARFLFGEYFEFIPQFKLFLGTNHKPLIRGTDNAIWRRIRLVPFKVAIPEEKQNKNLLEELKEELPGILNWSLDGCLKLQKEGLKEPEEVKKATKEYRTESDIIGQFLESYTIEKKKEKINSTKLYHKYKDWCDEDGERSISQNAFGRTLTERGYKTRHFRDGDCYLDLKLKGDKDV